MLNWILRPNYFRVVLWQEEEEQQERPCILVPIPMYGPWMWQYPDSYHDYHDRPYRQPSYRQPPFNVPSHPYHDLNENIIIMPIYPWDIKWHNNVGQLPSMGHYLVNVLPHQTIIILIPKRAVWTKYPRKRTTTRYHHHHHHHHHQYHHPPIVPDRATLQLVLNGYNWNKIRAKRSYGLDWTKPNHGLTLIVPARPWSKSFFDRISDRHTMPF